MLPPMERRTYLHKKYLFKKGFALFTLIFLTGSFSLTAHAEEETDTAAWLVRYHQVMSQTAFQRDISDEKTIDDFAFITKSIERLHMLLLITCADILAVGPNVWSEWKAAAM